MLVGFVVRHFNKAPRPLDPLEPRRVAESVRRIGLKYAMITSVDRDDLDDGGAEHWAETVQEVRRLSPKTMIELLIPDFQGDLDDVDTVLRSQPDVVGHNLEAPSGGLLLLSDTELSMRRL